MDEIIVKADDLRELLRQVGNDKMKYIELSLIEGEEFHDEPVVNCISISATNDGIEYVKYGTIDEVDID